MERSYLGIVEKALEEVLPGEAERPAELSAAMRYAVGTGGKRIRPLICLASAVAAGGSAEDARYPAAAIELLHSYTLVHDDLPAMDNDTERRGQPSVWAKFGEANAILAGDALQALAFSAAARSPRNAADVVAALGAAGVGVVQGQVEDVAIAGAQSADASKVPSAPKVPSVPDVPFIYTHKTADLFMAAAEMGALAAGAAEGHVAALREYARNLGLAFQFEDDLIDGDGAFPPDETARLVDGHTAAALAALESLPGDTSFLKNLAERLKGRTK